MIFTSKIDQFNSMYPCVSYMLSDQQPFEWSDDMKWSSIYGYSFGYNSIKGPRGTIELEQGQYFSLFSADGPVDIKTHSKLFVVVRLGFKCYDTLGWAESQGRLTYIDGCTDSLLIYPPRQGDPSLNLLHFPPGIEQTRHLHPSIRMGCVTHGHGWSDVWEDGQVISKPLKAGDSFCLVENELHRFRTENSSMTVVAWHPDGDWGPTDHNHTMLNRTYTK